MLEPENASLSSIIEVAKIQEARHDAGIHAPVKGESPFPTASGRALAPGLDELQTTARSYLNSSNAILVLAIFFTLFVAKSLFLPVTVAVLLFFLLSPAVRTMNKKLRIPYGIGAALVMATLLAFLFYTFYSMAIPATQWLEHAPENLRTAQSKISILKAPWARMQEATGEVKAITNVGESTKPQEVSVRDESGMLTLWSKGTDILEQVAIVIMLCYFLLASGDMFLRKTIHVIPRVKDKIKTVELAREIESEIGHYLVTIAVINVALGTITAFAMWLLGMPTPVLWGLMVGALAFIPYVGATISLVALTTVALVTFDAPTHALLVSGVFIVIDVIVEQFINPIVIGRRLELNPVVVFVGLVFWGWMWGVVGALIAMPLVVVAKVICDHSERLHAVGDFLGGERAKDE